MTTAGEAFMPVCPQAGCRRGARFCFAHSTFTSAAAARRARSLRALRGAVNLAGHFRKKAKNPDATKADPNPSGPPQENPPTLMNARVTMADVAKQAGVHVTTVSLALRNHPSLPVTTRQRLRDLAEKMGYQPDPALCSLVAYRRGARPRKDKPILAYVTHWDSRYGWKDASAHSAFFDGASRKATDLGYQIEHFWLGEPGLTHQRMSDILYSRGITGVIVASHRREVDVPLKFDWSRFSAVKIDVLPHEPELHHVTNDQRAIVQLAVRRVISAGYKRIGFVMHAAWDESLDLAWSAGFLAEQQKLAPADRIPIFRFPEPLPNLDSQEPPDFYVAPRGKFEAWFKQHRPEVLVSKRSFVQPRLNDMGISIPGDLAFVDIFLEAFDGTTAGVRQNNGTVGEQAVEILVGQLHQHKFGLPAFPTATLVEGTWFDGESLPSRALASGAGARTATTV